MKRLLIILAIAASAASCAVWDESSSHYSTEAVCSYAMNIFYNNVLTPAEIFHESFIDSRTDTLKTPMRMDSTYVLEGGGVVDRSKSPAHYTVECRYVEETEDWISYSIKSVGKRLDGEYEAPFSAEFVFRFVLKPKAETWWEGRLETRYYKGTQILDGCELKYTMDSRTPSFNIIN